MWLMDGSTISSEGSVMMVGDLNWQIEGVGDYDGGGKSDILWRHATQGWVSIWFMNGTTIYSEGSPGVVNDLNWKIMD
jgi:hypothetical protein